MQLYLFLKRFFDIVFALVGMALTFPLIGVLMLMLLIKGEKRPLFSQQRVGKGGRLITIYKLRTLRESPNLPLTASNDTGVSPFCRFLRNTKMDEFPQLINILKGDLSFIGPRPLVPEIFYAYSPKIQSDVLSVKPGLSGMGSLAFRNENQLLKEIPQKDYLDFYHRHIGPKKGQLEQWYVQQRGFWTDIKILILTPCALIQPDFKIPTGWFKGLPETKIKSDKITPTLSYLKIVKRPEQKQTVGG